jgi:hypothetical protein
MHRRSKVFKQGKLLREEKRVLTVLRPSAESIENALPQRSRLGPPPLEPGKK